MKLQILLLFGFPLFACAQVGIATNAPTATLDVNGNFRIRQTAQNLNDSSAKDSVLVVNNKGDVARVSAKQIVQSYLKTFVKGSFLHPADKSLTLSSGTQKIPFDYEEFDTNAEFDTGSNTFTAKESGIYEIAIQIKANNTVSVASNFGVAILKNNTVVARSSFANVGVTLGFVTINVTPPVRSTQTLLQLAPGDTVKFNLYSDLINVGVLGLREDCFFSIHQVH